MIKKLFLTLALLTIASTQALAILDDTEDLKGATVIYAGDFEAATCPIGGKYDCLSWPQNFYRHGADNFCFSTNSSACGYGCKGLVTVDSIKIPRFFIFERLGGVKKGSVQPLKCPDRF